MQKKILCNFGLKSRFMTLRIGIPLLIIGLYLFLIFWQILVGPSDWDDHGKEGASRYRIHNLPENFPGLYELSIVKPGTKAGRKTRSDDLKDVMVVYLGQADNVRTRLQDYGRTGSHLECGKLDSLAKREHVPVKKEPGLFREVLARGFSIAFRCVPVRISSTAFELKNKFVGSGKIRCRSFQNFWVLGHQVRSSYFLVQSVLILG